MNDLIDKMNYPPPPPHPTHAISEIGSKSGHKRPVGHGLQTTCVL